MANRTTVKANVVTKNVPTVTNDILTDILNAEMNDNIQFKEDVAVPQTSAISNITVNFTDKDRIDLTRLGGSLIITVSGMNDGERKFLLITKTGGQQVSWSGVTDITPGVQDVTALSVVLYEIVRKSIYYFAKAWIQSPTTATDTKEGLFERATTAEHNALSTVSRFVVPGRIPEASQSQKGVVELCNDAEAQAYSDTEKALTPGTMPYAATSYPGVVERAGASEYANGNDEDGYGKSLYPLPSQVKASFDALMEEDDTITIINGGTTYGYLYLNRISKNVNGIFKIENNENAGARVLATNALAANFRPAAHCGFSRRAEASGEINYIEFEEGGSIYFGIDFATGDGEQKSFGFSYITA